MMKKNDEETKKLFLPVINHLKNKNFDKALELLDELLKQKQDKKIILKLKGSLLLKKKEWMKSILCYEKSLNIDDNKFEAYNNIGVAFFNLGELSKAVVNFRKALNQNSKYLPTYESLGISYKRLGNYDLSIKYFLEGLNLDTSNINIRHNLIDLFNYFEPKNYKSNIITINKKIITAGIKCSKNKIINTIDIFKLLEASDEIVTNNSDEIIYRETQIFRKNKTNLNCKRHLKIFNIHKIIPNYCFNCFKVQIKLKNVVDMIKLFFYFNNLKLNNNNIRKCIVETRDNIKGNYKGYIYANGISEAKEILIQLRNNFEKEKISFNKIEIKHGCSEYYKEYKLFEEIHEDNKKKIYKKDWTYIEKKFDNDNFIKEKDKERIFDNTINQFNLSDFLIIKNWLIYAKIIGDESYKDVFKTELKTSYLKSILERQIDFRKNDLTLN